MRKRVFFAILVLLVIASVFIYTKISAYIKPLYQLTFDKKIELKKTEGQRITILLLGIGGGSHEGPLLTDTIIFASIDPEKKKVALVSIPRDLWIPHMHAKINTVYAYSEAKKGLGLRRTKEIVGNIVGQKIDYGLLIDFNGFIQAVDMVGGIDFDIERTFDDYAYPLSGKEEDACGHPDDEIASLSAQIATGSATDFEYFPCRFEYLHFEKGSTHMNGEEALKFVRSRHALGREGTDFARSKRQEKVIRAVKDKIFSVETFINPVRVVNLFEILKTSIDTDIKEDEVDDFIKLAQKMKSAGIYSAVLDVNDGEDEKVGLLMNPTVSEEFGYQWVIIPQAGSDDYTDVHAYVSCVINWGEECNITPTPKENKY